MYKRRDSGGRENFGNYMLMGNYPHRVYSPKSEKPGNDTIVRVFCAVDPSGEFSPQVVQADDPMQGIGDSFHARECVAWLGSKKLQFITETSDFPDKESPTRMFYNKLDKLIEDEGKKKFTTWADWFDWQGGMNLPSCKMMVQGILLELDGEPLLDKKGKPSGVSPIVLVLQRSATIDLEDSLITPVDENEPISAANSAIGDITSPQDGGTLVIRMEYNKENKARYLAGRGVDMPIAEDYVKAQFVPWEKLLRIETAAWQIARLADTFDAASVDYVFSQDSDYAEFIPEHCQGAFNAEYKASSHPSAEVPRSKSRVISNDDDDAPAWKAPAKGKTSKPAPAPVHTVEDNAEAEEAGLVAEPEGDAVEPEVMERETQEAPPKPEPKQVSRVVTPPPKVPPAKPQAPQAAKAPAAPSKEAFAGNPVMQKLLAEKRRQLEAKAAKAG